MAERTQPGDRVPVLLVDDEPLLLETLAVILESRQFSVTSCLDADGALRAIGASRFALLLTDLNLPGDGATVVRAMREQQAWARIIVVTGYVAPGDIAREVREAADVLLHKPLDIAELLATMAGLLAP